MKMRIAHSAAPVCMIIVLSCMQSVARDEFIRLNNEGYKHLRNGEYERGIQDFNEALCLNPDYVLAHGNRGIAYFILGRFEDTLRDFQAIRTVLPQSDAALKFYLAGARMGKSDPAVLTDMEAHVVPDAFLMIAIADYYLGKKTRDAVLQDLKDRKKNKEWFCYAYFYLGEGAFLERNRPEAMRLLQLSIDTGFKDRPEFFWAKGELQNLRAAPAAQASAPITPSTPDNGVVSDSNAEKPQEGLKSTAGEPGISAEDRPRDDRGSMEGQTYKNAATSTDTVTLPDGTPLTLRLETSLSSATAKVGDPVQFKVARPILAHGFPFVPNETSVSGTIVQVRHSGHFGKNGEFNIAIKDIALPVGTSISVRQTVETQPPQWRCSISRKTRFTASPSPKFC